MSSSLYEIITRAQAIAAGRGGEQSPIEDAGITLEALFDHALLYVYAKRLRTGENVQDLSKTHTITFADGIGDLPTTVLRSAIHLAYTPDTLSSYVAPQDFTRRTRFGAILGQFTVEGDSVKYRPPNETAYDGDADFVFVTIPAKNTDENGFTEDLDLDKTVVDDVVMTMAGALTGEIPLKEILENRIY